MVYDEAIPLEYTVHAIVAMYERNILAEWVQRVVNAPTLRLPDSHDTELERFFRAIPENEDRVLRVVVNTHTMTWRVVSVFFDRAMKGEL